MSELANSTDATGIPEIILNNSPGIPVQSERIYSDRWRENMNSAIEADLVKRCKAHDLAAFRDLVKECRGVAYSFAFSYLHNSDDAMAVSQDAFVRAWSRFGTFREGNSFRSWLLGIVRNLSLDVLNTKKRRREFSIDEAMEESGFDLPDTGPDPHDALEKSEIRAQVWKAIMGLKQEFREIVILKHFHDLSYREISESLDIPEGTVMSRLFHARLALKKSLEPVLFGGDHHGR